MLEKTGSGHRQRIKERFMAGEEDSRTDDAVLELLLTYAIPQKDVQPLARSLIETFGSLSAVLEASHETLCSFDGIKSYSSVLLKLVDWIRSHYPAAGRSEEGRPEETRVKQLPLFPSSTAPGPVQPVPERKGKKFGKKAIARRGTEMFSKALLWNPARILPALYELRNTGVISKVSEIDSVRQFTTMWTLEQVVDQLASRENAYERY